MSSKKKFAPGQEFGFIGETKSKSKPREVTTPEWLTQYFIDRDNVLLGDMFVEQSTKDLIIERRKI